MSFVEAILISIEIICVFGCSILIHELTHYYVYKRISHKTAQLVLTRRGIHLKSDDDFKSLTKDEYLITLTSGIFAGLLFLAIFTQPYPLYLFIPILILYLYGCKGDLKEIWKTKTLKE